MIQHVLSEDLSILTTIPQASINNLSDKAIFCICDSIEEAILYNENEVALKIGFGTLRIGIDGEEISYRFEPNRKLESSVAKTVIDGKNPLVAKVEETLVKSITKTYKDFI